MKTIEINTRIVIFTAIILLFKVSNSFGVTIYTPNGTPVYVFSVTEMSSQQIAAANADAQAAYPNAVMVANSSSTYNCHSYAFYLSECTGCTKYWMNSPEDDTYWNDDSYVEVCSVTGAEKVSYASDDHSAIVSTISGKFESKWGSWPLMRHDPNDTPYDETILKYYISEPNATGVSLICTSDQTFSVSNIPSGTTVNWSVSPSNLVYTSFGSGTSANIKAATSSSSGEATITFSVGSCTNKNYSKKFWVGKPNYNNLVLSVDNNELSNCDETYADAGTISPGPTMSITAYEWRIPYSSDWYIDEEYGGLADYQYVAIDYYEQYPPLQEAIQIRGSNSCGLSYWKEFWVNVDNCGYSPFAFGPNPAMDELTISKKDPGYSEVVIHNNSMEEVYYLASSDDVIKIPVSGFPEGVYYLQVVSKKGTVRERILIER